MRIAGHSVLITGGGGGIGAAAAHGFAEHGLVVHIADRDLSLAEEAAASVRSSGGQAHAHEVDVAESASVSALFAAVDEHGPGPDVLVSAAGVIAYAPAPELTEERLRAMVDVNVFGTYLCLQEASRRMIERGHGRIINLASTASFVATRLPGTAYAMTKGGVRQLTVAAAAELGPYGVHVNAVAPGSTRTRFVQGTLDTPEQRERAAQAIPLRRVAEPEDIVGPILFFASEEAGYVTGQVLLVDGGRTTRSY
jgi:NAD(P)-dependent dehydrogenase (short-subunit alcohol dehydrogenase family)